MERTSAFAIDLPGHLLEDARRGKAAAWETIYRRFEGPVFTLALRMTARREDAEEILHDTLLRAWERIGDFRGDAPFWGWLRQIAVNTTLMRLRRRERVEFTDEPPEAVCDADADWLPPAAADAARLRQALDELPATTRSVLWLYHGEGFTHEEIGRLMGHGPSFSKSRVSRGTRQLRTLLGVGPKEVDHV